METKETNQTTRIIWAVVVVVIIAILLFVLPGTDKRGDAPSEEVEITVDQVDVENARDDKSKLPKGFPTDIPVPGGTITEAYSSDYQNRGYTQHTVVYTTSDTMDSLHTLYEVFMAAAGYEITNSSVDGDLAFISGTRDGDDLTVVVASDSDSRREVSLNYLERE